MANKRKKKQAAARKAAAQAVDTDKRTSLSTIRNWAIGAAVVGGGGYWFATDVQATMREHDLTRLGQGVPTVVQIHDPSCALCTELQRNTRRALKAFDDGRLQYVVANINTPEGAGLAGRYGVSHVTLLLFDGQGEMQEALHGVRQRDELEGAFSAHLARNESS